MKRKFMEKDVVLKLKYLQSKCDFERNHFIGGVEEPSYLDELNIDIYDDMEFDMDEEKFKKNGKIVLELSGSDRSLFELGKYLINVALYDTEDPDFHEHFDGLLDSEHNEKVNLLVRKKNN